MIVRNMIVAFVCLGSLALAQSAPAQVGCLWLRAEDPAAAAAAITKEAGVRSAAPAGDGGLVLVRHDGPGRALLQRLSAAGVRLESSGAERALSVGKVVARARALAPGSAPAWCKEAAGRSVASVDVLVLGPDDGFPSGSVVQEVVGVTGAKETLWSGISRELRAGQRVFELIFDEGSTEATLTVRVTLDGGAPVDLVVPVLAP